jgi:hypothetical protein
LNEKCIFAKKIWNIVKTFYVRIAAAKIFKKMVIDPQAFNVGVAIGVEKVFSRDTAITLVNRALKSKSSN